MEGCRPMSNRDASTESSPGTHTLCVGGWTVEPSLNQLLAPGRIVKLEPKSMEVLLCLAVRPGQVMSREALLSAVWPGIVVGDDCLTQVVTKLRRALKEVPEASAYIETISKRGYRLVAPVTRTLEGSSAPVASLPRPADSGRRFPLRRGAGVAVFLLAAAAVWGIEGRRAVDSEPGHPPRAGADAARTMRPTVAVRPFEALGNDLKAVLLAQGITADLVTDLSKVSGLSVISIAHRDAHAGAGTRTDAAPSRYLVSGSVQRIDERLRLHIHLTDGETGKQLWSERFDSAPADLFVIQEDLGPKILRVLPAKVSEEEVRRMAHRHTRNMEAYEYFQRGQAAFVVRQKEENETARQLFRNAIALDPAFARAYAWLALTYTADYRDQWAGDGAAALDRAFELARTAYQINPDIRETYWVLALVHRDRHQQEQALQYLETAIRLYPSYADAYALMGNVKTYMGRPAEAVPLLLTALRLNPEGGNFYFLTLGRTYFALGDLEQARANLEHALSRNASNLDAHVYMAVLHLTAGDKAAAAWEAEEIRALRPGFSGHAWLETNPMDDIRQKTKLLGALGALGL
jgi:DNA-binding winged helix-turn-helix (wHTH) protein/TolB-like protein/Tfp pilus assembly protein PilF